MADKKKIGIAAVTYKENFGSALQTYATQYTLEKMGYDARIFEIKGVHREIHIKKLLYYAGRMFDSVELKYLLANLKSRSRKTASASTDQYAQEMKVRKQGRLMTPDKDYSFDFNTLTLKFHHQSTYYTYKIIIQINVDYINNLIKEIYHLS